MGQAEWDKQREELIKAVSEIDIAAGAYLKMVLPREGKIGSYVPNTGVYQNLASRLDHQLRFKTTPQGMNFWHDMLIKLKQREKDDETYGFFINNANNI